MISDCSKRTKVYLAAIAGTILVAGVVIGVTVPTTASNENSKNGIVEVAGSANGVDLVDGVDDSEESANTLVITAECPCYDGKKLDIAMAHIISGDYTFDPSNICTGENFDGLQYLDPESRHPFGYSLDSSDLSFMECSDGDAKFILNFDEEIACRDMLNEKCDDNPVALMTAEPIIVTCPCYQNSDLVPILRSVEHNATELQSSSCVPNGDELSISHTLKTNGGFPEYYAWGVSSMDIGEGIEKTCIHHDTVQFINEGEYFVCEKIVQDACDLLP